MEAAKKHCSQGHEKIGNNCPMCRRAHYLANKAKNNQQSREYYIRNKELVLERTKERAKASPEKCKQYQAKSRAKPSRKAKRAADVRLRRASDSRFHLIERCRALATAAFGLKRVTKTKRTQEMLGCDWDTLDAHLMQTALENYGVWCENTKYHIDHKEPFASAKTEADIISRCHYTNLQLLLPEHNMSKGAKPFDRSLLCSRKV
jgi:hypothetical protein